ncbi:ATP-dependent helicase/nuclease subunit A [Bienertia sinuspersici]
MDSTLQAPCSWLLFIVFSSILCFQSLADDSGSLFMIDSTTHQYLRSSPRQIDETNSMSGMEIGAALSILLGQAPPPMLSTASSSKLNELLLPNPFDRPHHVFMLEIALAQGSFLHHCFFSFHFHSYGLTDILSFLSFHLINSQATDYSGIAEFSSAIKSKVVRNDGGVKIELSDKEGVSFFSLDGPDYDSYEAITEKELNKLESLNGELIIPLPSGVKMTLHMSKKADRKFATGMMYLIDNIRKVTEMTQNMAGSSSNSAELVGGYFDGIKALQEEYGSTEIAQQALELLLTTVSKAVDSLQERHEGKIVTTILLSKAYSSLPQRMLEVTYVSRPYPRLLEESKNSTNSTAVAEVALVRGTVAWMTGLVLIIATLIGVYLLFSMPITRDTLLYCNVKLD